MAILIFVLSLLISLATFVVTNVRVHHHLFAIAQDSGFLNEEELKNDTPHRERLHIIMNNGGNRTEAIVGVAYTISKFGEARISERFTTPIVLKPGDATVITVSMLTETVTGNLEEKPGMWTDFGFTALVSLPNGSVDHTFYKVGEIRLQKQGSPAMELQYVPNPQFELVDSSEFALGSL